MSERLKGRRRSAGRVAAFVLLGGSLALASVLLPSGAARAQGTSSVGAVVYLPLGHPAYQTLERFRAAGLVSGRGLDQRPISRRAMAEALTEGVRRARERGLLELGEAGVWRLREFADEGYGGMQGLRRRSTPFALHWEDGAGAWLNAELTGEGAWSGRTDIPPDNKKAAVGTGGAEVYGHVGPTVGYAARYRQTTELRTGTVRAWPYDPRQNVARPRMFGDGNAAYSESSGHLSVDWTYFGLDLRFDSPAWGPSPAGDLILSGHAPSFGHVQGRLALGRWLRYSVLAGSLRSGIIDSTGSYQPPGDPYYRALERQKYLIGHRLDVYPTDHLRIGFTEAVIAADRFPELLYFVPTVSIWDAQHYLNDPDNTMMGVDLTWSPEGGPRLYAAVALDEFRLSEVLADSTNRNWLALQVGGSWTPPLAQGRLTLWLEVTRVLPNVYRHKFPVNDWTSDDSPLGFWSTQNSDVIQGSASWLLTERSTIGVWGRYARKGGLVSIAEQYQTPPAEQFLFGPVRTGGWVGARFSLEGEQHWRTEVEVVRAPALLWPQTAAGSSGQETQAFLRLIYNPF